MEGEPPSQTVYQRASDKNKNIALTSQHKDTKLNQTKTMTLTEQRELVDTVDGSTNIADELKG